MKKNIIAIANQKGGVGKTTSTLNLASALSLRKKKVLVIDLDPQGNATTGCGLIKNNLEVTVYHVLIGKSDIASAIYKTESNGFDIIPSSPNVAGAEIELVSMFGREFQLKKALASIVDNYDYILLDCPPSLGLLTINGLSAAEYIVVPIQCEFFALEGLTDLMQTLKKLNDYINPQLELLGIIRTMFDKRNNLSIEVSNQLANHFGEKMFKVAVPRNVRMAEAPSYGITAVMADKNAPGSQAYIEITNELINRLKTKNI